MKNKKPLIVLLFLFPILIFNVKGQIEHYHGIPPSSAFNYKINIPDSELNTVYTEPVNVNNLQSLADSVSLTTGLDYFGRGISCNIDILSQATEEDIDNGSLYRLKIVVPGAKGLQFFFNQFHLSDSSLLYFYNPEKTLMLGGYNEENNRSYNKFATNVISSDTVIIEYFIPNTSSPNKSTYSELQLSRIIVDFRGVNKKSGVSPSSLIGSSLPCEYNVACSIGNDWKTERASVARFLFYDVNENLSALCTGALINNTNEDGMPYFLSAHHCTGDPYAPSIAYDYWNWVFQFHFEAQSCTATGYGAPTNYTLSGCTYLTSNNANSLQIIYW